MTVTTRTGSASPHRVVVVGGGAAGLELATALGDKFGRKRRAEVTLVDRARTHIWKPLLHSIAAGSLRRSRHELNYLAQAHWHHFGYRHGDLAGIDPQARTVSLAETHDDEGRLVSPERRIGYDTLVIAIGSVTNDFGTPGAAEHAVPLETPEQAARFNRRLVNACLRAQSQEAPIRPGQLHVAIIGAGATGTELAAELHRTARDIVAYGLDRIVPERDIQLHLLDAAERILPALPERISAEVLEQLNKLGIKVHVRARVSAVDAEGVTLDDGRRIPAELVVWAAGVKAPDVLAGIGGLETNRSNQLVVRPTLQTTRDDDIFAIGDCAAAPMPDGRGTVPPRAQAAHQEASFLVRQIAARLEGRPLGTYRYRDFGSLISLGRYTTVGNLMGNVGRSVFVEGAVARLMYRSLYKMHEAALHGGGRMLWSMLTPTDKPTPSVKLH